MTVHKEVIHGKPVEFVRLREVAEYIYDNVVSFGNCTVDCYKCPAYEHCSLGEERVEEAECLSEIEIALEEGRV